MEHIKLPHAATITGIVILAFILIGQRFLVKKEFPQEPMKIVLDRNIPLVSLIAGDDETIAKLHKGDTVEYLGVVSGMRQYPYGLLVQTKDGERGLLSAAEMKFPMLLTDKQDSVPVTVRNLFREKSKQKGQSGTLYYNIVTGSGEKKKVRMDEIRPILPDSLSNTRLQRAGDYFMTKEKFERLYIGHKLADNDALYRPAWLIDKTKKGFLAYYPNIEVIDLSDGKMRNPMVVYGADSVAITYGFAEGHTVSKNRLIVKWLPFLGKIIDADFFAHIIEGSMYDNWINTDDENYTAKPETEWSDVPFVNWIGLIIYVIFGLIWVFLIGTLPSLIADASLYCRYLYFHLSDGVVETIFGIVAFVFTYIWLALMAVWGCHWFFLPIVLGAGIGAWAYSTRLLNNSPHDRCLQCRRMETVYFRNKEFMREYDEWRSDSQAISSYTDRWKTWTDVSWSDGSHTRENEQNHSRTTTRYADYRVLYHVREYHNHFQCSECGHVETLRSEDLEELQRVKTGEHTTVSES